MFVVRTVTVLSAVAANADNTAGVFDMNGIDLCSLEVTWASFANAGAAATLKIQTSDLGTSWDDMPKSTITVSGSTGIQTYSINAQDGMRFIRLNYAHGGASAGTITATAISKTVGAP
jgi:hypothetical protein